MWLTDQTSAWCTCTYTVPARYRNLEGDRVCDPNDWVKSIKLSPQILSLRLINIGERSKNVQVVAEKLNFAENLNFSRKLEF